MSPSRFLSLLSLIAAVISALRPVSLRPVSIKKYSLSSNLRRITTLRKADLNDGNDESSGQISNSMRDKLLRELQENGSDPNFSKGPIAGT